MLVFEDEGEPALLCHGADVAPGHHPRDKQRPNAEETAHGEFGMKLGLLDVGQAIFDLHAP